MVDSNNQSKVQADIEVLRGDLAKVQRDIREIAESMVNMGARQARQVSDRMGQQFESGVDKLQEYVERRPVATLATAFVVGLLAGKLFGR